LPQACVARSSGAVSRARLAFFSRQAKRVKHVPDSPNTYFNTQPLFEFLAQFTDRGVGLVGDNVDDFKLFLFTQF